MPSYLIHKYMTCEVVFVRRIEADNETDAMEAAYEGAGDLLGVSIGDAVAGYENTEILSDVDYNIPAAFYPEPTTST